MEEERLIRKKTAPSPIEFGDLTATAPSTTEVGKPSVMIFMIGALALTGNDRLPAHCTSCRSVIDRLHAEIARRGLLDRASLRDQRELG